MARQPHDLPHRVAPRAPCRKARARGRPRAPRGLPAGRAARSPRPRRGPGSRRCDSRRHRVRGRTPRRSRARGPPSGTAGRARSSRREPAQTSGVGSASVQRVCSGSSATRRAGTSASVPRPTMCSSALRNTRRGESPCLREHVDRLVALEHADEERSGPFGELHRRLGEEGLEVHERCEGRARLDACRANDARGVVGDGSDRVRPAQTRAWPAHRRAVRAASEAASRRDASASPGLRGCRR